MINYAIIEPTHLLAIDLKQCKHFDVFTRESAMSYLTLM